MIFSCNLPQAWDRDGGLETSLAASDNGTSLFRVRLRNPVPHGRRYAFSYSYETGIRAVVTRGILEQTVTYADWQRFNVECRALAVAVELPPKVQLIRTVPAAGGDGRGAVRYRNPLRPSETLQYMVCYRSRRLGAGFSLWVASAVGSALVGMMLNELLSTVGK